MISGINGYSGIYGYQAMLNQYKLSQAMQSRGSSFRPIQPVSPVFSNKDTLTDSISYLKNYSSSMSDLMNSANALRGSNKAGVANQLSVSSSDQTVMDASNRFKLTSPTTYEVNVSQLAKAQTNTSDAVSSSAKATGDISMQITGNGGNINVQVSSLDANGKQKSNSQMLSEAAAQVNKAGAGVKASVITKDGKSSLQLESVKTGSENSFNVSGSFAQNGGMSNVTQAAQNASYTVTENGATKSYTSATNNIRLGTGKIDATLKKEGTATLTVGQDPQQTVSAMEKFVASYNNTVNLLSKNTDKGSGTVRQLEKLQSYVPGSKEGMDRMGLSFNKDGTLSLDKTKLSKNLAEDPSLTKDLISGASGLAQRAFSTAQSASTSTVGSLIGNSLASAQYSQATDSINMMSSFSRSGAYNMMNLYASGMLLNRSV